MIIVTPSHRGTISTHCWHTQGILLWSDGFLTLQYIHSATPSLICDCLLLVYLRECILKPELSTSGRTSALANLPFVVSFLVMSHTLSQIAPVLDASNSQSRADVLGIVMSAVLLLTGLQWIAIKAKALVTVSTSLAKLSCGGNSCCENTKLIWCFQIHTMDCFATLGYQHPRLCRFAFVRLWSPIW